VRQEFVDHADVDVAFEQRLADSGEGLIHVLLGQLSLAAQVLEHSLQLVGEVLEHRSRFPWARSRTESLF
jgi:hypothetical protein